MDTSVDKWAAWQETKALAFLHARIRQLLVAQGIQDTYVDVQGHPVHVYMGGPADARRTVVLLHGLGDSANNWFRTLPLLAWRGDRVIAIDLPGHGHSPPFDERGFLHIREHAEVVRDIVARHAVGDKLAVVGHSLGGWVAAKAHLSGMPMDTLVLVESAGLAHEGMWEGIELLRIEKQEDVRKFFKTICHHTPFALHLLSHEVAAMFRSPAVVNFINAYERDDIIHDEELEAVTARTTILWGENDGLIPPSLAHRWNSAIPGSRLRWMSRCGHTPQFERPVLFHRLLEEALGHPPVHETIRDKMVARMPAMLRRRLAKA
ncbi:MAG TPA: alpha/beta fold hydrolase [Candidatus Thermoplasmatota archaeon]|nr:alpha/beta fold hydrolase [Candidatus Thermoplasmatota archaeon]